MNIKKYIFFIIPMMASFCISLNAMHNDFGTIGNEEPELELPSDPFVFTGSAIMSDADLKNLLNPSQPPQLPPMNSNNGQPVASTAPQLAAGIQVADATSLALASDIDSKLQATSSSNNGERFADGAAVSDNYCHACKKKFRDRGNYTNHRKSLKCLANAHKIPAAAAAKAANSYCSICEHNFGEPHFLQYHRAAPGTADLHAAKIKEREKRLANGNGMQLASNNFSYECSCGESYQFTSQRDACEVGHKNKKGNGTHKYKLHKADSDEDDSYGKEQSPTQRKKAKRSARRASSAHQ